jgi:hypothetical protein
MNGGACREYFRQHAVYSLNVVIGRSDAEWIRPAKLLPRQRRKAGQENPTDSLKSLANNVICVTQGSELVEHHA